MLAVIAAFYPGMVDRFLRGDITDTQIEVLLRELGYVRFLRDQQALRYAFSKFSDEDCEKMLTPSGAENTARRRAWAEFAYRPYGLLEDDRDATGQAQPIPGMSREVADAICAWWERGDCPDDVWARDVVGVYAAIIATASA